MSLDWFSVRVLKQCWIWGRPKPQAHSWGVPRWTQLSVSAGGRNVDIR